MERKAMQRQRDPTSDCGQPLSAETIVMHLTCTLCSLDCSSREFKPIFSQEKKGSLMSGSAQRIHHFVP